MVGDRRASSGTNLAFAEERLPHLCRILVATPEEALADADAAIVGTRADDLLAAAPRRAGLPTVLDLVGTWPELEALPGCTRPRLVAGPPEGQGRGHDRRPEPAGPVRPAGLARVPGAGAPPATRSRSSARPDPAASPASRSSTACASTGTRRRRPRAAPLAYAWEFALLLGPHRGARPPHPPHRRHGRAPGVQPARHLLGAGPPAAPPRRALRVRPARPLPRGLRSRVRPPVAAAPPRAPARSSGRPTAPPTTSIVTNESYRRRRPRARATCAPSDVTVVRTGPDPRRLRRGAPDPALRRGRDHLVTYLGVMGPQDGVDLRRAGHPPARARPRPHRHDVRPDRRRRRTGPTSSTSSTSSVSTTTSTCPAGCPTTLLFRYLSTADLGLSPDPPNPLNDVSTMNKTMEYMAFELPGGGLRPQETMVSGGDAAVYAPGRRHPPPSPASVADLLDDPEPRRVAWARRAAGGSRTSSPGTARPPPTSACTTASPAATESPARPSRTKRDGAHEDGEVGGQRPVVDVVEVVAGVVVEAAVAAAADLPQPGDAGAHPQAVVRGRAATRPPRRAGPGGARRGSCRRAPR